MRKRVDYLGKRFGRLKVTDEAPNKGKRTRWLCECDCGNFCIINTDELRSGDTESCGCLKKDLLFEDITGQKFGKLTALKCLKDKKLKSCTTYAWECLCDCGNIYIVDGNCLRTGHTKTCGCAFSEEELFKRAKETFFEKVEKTETCWIWKGASCQGYGVLGFLGQWKAHRFSYWIHKGELKKGLMVCHTCDNKLCVNPDHLYLGTAKDNARDASERGQMPHGENHHKAKLTEEDVKYILTSGERGIDLANRYGMSENMISAIRTRKFWKKIQV